MENATINQRIKYIRNILHLSRDKFGKMINVSAKSVLDIETGKKNTSDRIILNICKAYSVREDWLRVGEGEVFNKYNEMYIKQLAKEFNLNNEDEEFLKRYVYLSKDERNKYNHLEQ